MGVAYCLNVRKILNLPDSKHRRKDVVQRLVIMSSPNQNITIRNG